MTLNGLADPIWKALTRNNGAHFSNALPNNPLLGALLSTPFNINSGDFGSAIRYFIGQPTKESTKPVKYWIRQPCNQAHDCKKDVRWPMFQCVAVTL